MTAGRRQRLSARRRRILRTARLRRRAGQIMVVIAAVGVFTALSGMVVGWLVISDVNDATHDSLDVTIESLDSLEDTLGLAGEVMGSTTASLTAVEANLDALDASFAAGSAVTSDASDLTGAAGPALGDAATTLRQMETLGAQIDGLLATVSTLPLAPDYNPDAGLEVTFGQLAGDLEPLPDQFAATSDSLARFEGSITTLQTEVASLADSVRAVNDGLDGSEELLGQYQANVAEARRVAEDSRRDLTRDENLLRLVIVIAGLNFAASQLVPLWVGWELLEEATAVADLPSDEQPDDEPLTSSGGIPADSP